MYDLQLPQRPEAKKDLPDVGGQRGQRQASPLSVLLKREAHVALQEVKDKAQVTGVLKCPDTGQVDEVVSALGVLSRGVLRQTAVHLDLFLGSLPHHRVGANELDGIVLVFLHVLAMVDAREYSTTNRRLNSEVGSAIWSKLFAYSSREVLFIIRHADLVTSRAAGCSAAFLPLFVVLLCLDHEVPQLVPLLRDAALDGREIREVKLLDLATCSCVASSTRRSGCWHPS
mmetsp:Transcript_54963/g.118779  ORF Transcript_54963/g.118779 Transcript_54963/m.118779 type:complete len:229 (+) Transcript_54963:724-1410(+)